MAWPAFLAALFGGGGAAAGAGAGAAGAAGAGAGAAGAGAGAGAAGAGAAGAGGAAAGGGGGGIGGMLSGLMGGGGGGGDIPYSTPTQQFGGNMGGQMMDIPPPQQGGGPTTAPNLGMNFNANQDYMSQLMAQPPSTSGPQGQGASLTDWGQGEEQIPGAKKVPGAGGRKEMSEQTMNPYAKTQPIGGGDSLQKLLSLMAVRNAGGRGPQGGQAQAPNAYIRSLMGG